MTQNLLSVGVSKKCNSKSTAKMLPAWNDSFVPLLWWIATVVFFFIIDGMVQSSMSLKRADWLSGSLMGCVSMVSGFNLCHWSGCTVVYVGQMFHPVP